MQRLTYCRIAELINVMATIFVGLAYRVAGTCKGSCIAPIAAAFGVTCFNAGSS